MANIHDTMEFQAQVAVKVVSEMIREKIGEEVATLREEQIKLLDQRLDTFKRKLIANTVVRQDKEFDGKIIVSTVVDPATLVRESGFKL